MELIADNADLDATPVTRGERSLEERAEELYQEVLSVAAGKLTKSEIYRHYEA
jgi:altronate dehydratase large subunit